YTTLFRSFQERPQTINAALTANPRLFKAAKTYAHIAAEDVVPNGARAQLPRHRISAIRIIGEYGIIEAKNAVVGQGNGVVFTVGGNNTKHGAKDLFTGNSVIVADIGEHCRLKVKAFF